MTDIKNLPPVILNNSQFYHFYYDTTGNIYLQ